MNKLKLYYQNVRGLRSKTMDFKLSTLTSEYDVLCLTETNLQDDIANAEFIDDKYQVFRKDRNLERFGLACGGGCLVAIRNDIIANREQDLETENEELWISVTLRNAKLYLCCLYIRPGTSNETYKTIFDNLSVVSQKLPLDAKILYLGDFNLPNIDWALDGATSTYVAQNFTGNAGNG